MLASLAQDASEYFSGDFGSARFEMKSITHDTPGDYTPVLKRTVIVPVFFPSSFAASLAILYADYFFFD